MLNTRDVVLLRKAPLHRFPLVGKLYQAVDLCKVSSSFFMWSARNYKLRNRSRQLFCICFSHFYFPSYRLARATTPSMKSYSYSLRGLPASAFCLTCLVTSIRPAKDIILKCLSQGHNNAHIVRFELTDIR